MPDNRRFILLQLADGAGHTGTALAARLKMTRAGVWKHIKALRANGVPVESNVSGYRIAGGLQLLDIVAIQSGLEDKVAAVVKLRVLEKTVSTNDWLLSRLQTGLQPGTACLAERQTAGRGTRGRAWQSPYGSNLYISLYWHFSRGPAELGGLSLSVAAAVASALTGAGARGVKIKWPNDLYTAAGKLGGILIDMVAEATGPSRVIIGLGLNLGMPLKNRQLIGRPVADLRDTGLPDTLNRSQLAALVINAMTAACRRFAGAGFAAFREDWLARDMTIGRRVRLSNGNRVITGRARGVNEAGALELLTESGRQVFFSGDVSLRPDDEIIN